MNDDLAMLKTENERLKTALHELSILHEISGLIGSLLPIDEVCRRVIKKVISTLQAREAAIFFFPEEGSHQPHTFVRDKLDSASMTKTKLDISIAGWIAHNKRPLVINDPRGDPRFTDAFLGENRMESLLAVPLTAKGKSIGALAIFNSCRPEKFSPEDMRLLSIIGVQAAQSLENARLYEEEIRLNQLEGEMNAARKIQEGFLPTQTPALSGYDIYGQSVPAKEVGGDFFDFIPSPDSRRLYFSVGDVSGKGLPAALLMATIQGQVRLLLNRDSSASPESVLSDINGITCQMASPLQFVTMIVGCLEQEAGLMTLSNCAHCYPIVVRNDGGVTEVSESSTVLGKFTDLRPPMTRIELGPGDFVALASDGIDEAFDAEGKQFGHDRVVAVLKANTGRPSAEIYRSLMHELETFRGAAKQSDDATLLIIKRIT